MTVYRPVLIVHVTFILGTDASISLFQFRYDIDTIFTKYHDIDVDIEYVSEMHTFADKF